MEVVDRHVARNNKSQFYFTGKPCKHGHVDKRYTISGACYTCSKSYNKQYRAEIKECPVAQQAHKELLADNYYSGGGAVKSMIRYARAKAKKLDIPFDITTDDITIPSHCYVTGEPLTRTKGRSGGGTNSPTLTLIDTKRGYVKDNLRIISFAAAARLNLFRRKTS